VSGQTGAKALDHLRYPPGSLIGDYLRSAFGVGVGAGVLAVNPVGWALGLGAGGLAGVFGLFGARTAVRHLTRVTPEAEGLTCRALATRRLAWAELSQVRLRYYGSRGERRRQGGFFQLTLRGAGDKLAFESSLEGFDYLVWRAAQAARANGLGLDDATAGNMQALGIDLDGALPPPPAAAELARRLERAASPAAAQHARTPTAGEVAG
jgi:hypothetical protein